MFNPSVPHILASIISILNDDNQIIGYGFFIDPHGTATTCYHVIAGLTNIRIRDNEGNEFEAVIDEYHTLDYADISNIAILRVPKETPSFLYLVQNEHIPVEITIVNVKEHGFECDDILYRPIETLRHPRHLHGLPVTITNTSIAIGYLSTTKRWPKVMYFVRQKKSPQLTLLLQYLSDKYCPEKFNPHERAIKTILNIQLQNAARNLIKKGIILPHCYEPDMIIHNLKFFGFPGNDIFFLTGESGTGKTSHVINIAADVASTYFTFFLPAHDFELTPDNLPGKIKSYLTKILAEHPHDTIQVDDIMELIFQQPKKCMIIIDGLNKMPRRPANFMNDWLKRSIRWARGLQIKLIFTSTYSSTEQHIYPIGGLSITQIEVVFARYSLPENFKHISRLQHPMLTRLHYEISSKERFAPLDDYPLMTTYLARKCTAIARLAHIPFQIVHNKLLDIARHFMTTGDYWLSHATYLQILQDYPQLSPLLIQENIFLESINGVRMINEWIADFLIGETLHPGINWSQLIPITTATHRKGIPWLFARLSFQKQDVSIQLQQLLTFIWDNNTYQRKAVKIFVHIIRHLSNPDKYYQLIESFCFPEQNDYFPVSKVGPMVYYSHLSFTNQLKLIRLTLSTEFFYPKQIIWYLGPQFYTMYLDTEYAAATKSILSRHLAINREKVLAHVAEWLYDCDNLTTHIVATIILTRYNKKPAYKFELIPFNKRSQDTPAQLLTLKTAVGYIIASQPPFIKALKEEWPKQRVYAPTVLNNAALYIKWITPLIPAILRKMTDEKEKLPAIIWLIRIPEYRKAMIAEILFLLKENKLPYRHIEELSPYVRQEEYFDMIVPMLVKYIGFGGHIDKVRECIPVLFQFSSNERQNLILAKNLRIMIEERWFDLRGIFIDHLIVGMYMLPATSEAYQFFCAMIPDLLQRDLKVWYPVTIYLCREEKCEHKRNDKIKWIKWGLEHLTLHTRCAIVVLLLDMNIIKEEDIVYELMKPTILDSLKESEQFYEAVLKKCAKKKHTALFNEVSNDLEFRVLLKFRLEFQNGSKSSFHVD